MTKFISIQKKERRKLVIQLQQLLAGMLVVFSLMYYCASSRIFLVPERSSSTQQMSYSSSWNSPHLFDCKTIQDNFNNHDDDETFFAITSTNPSFPMSIHNPKKDSVSSYIHASGCWECHHIKKMVDALDQNPNSYFLDIGGNIGMWTLAAAAAKKDTFTIEPSPENYKKICQTVNINGFHDQMHLITVAATTEPTKFTLTVPRGNKGGTRVRKVTGTLEDTAADLHVIEGIPIDSLNLPTDRPVVMKIDVEGHELQALLGALKFLQDANIVFAMMELRPNLADDPKWKEVINAFVTKGLEAFRQDGTKGDEIKLDPNVLESWKHQKHPAVRYYDVIWRKKIN